jgi:hypothetical protein
MFQCARSGSIRKGRPFPVGATRQRVLRGATARIAEPDPLGRRGRCGRETNDRSYAIAAAPSICQLGTHPFRGSKRRWQLETLETRGRKTAR